MKTCKYCKSEINEKAKVCPQCRRKQPSKGGVIAGIIVTIIVLFAILGSGDSSDGSATNNSSGTSTQAPKEEVISISAKDLFAAYEENEVKADNLYKGKQLEVTGVVSDISKDIADNVYVSLETDNMFLAIQCYVKDEKDVAKVTNLKAGDKVTLVGKCEGKLIHINVKNCKLK